jgi:hypothetical protein
VSSISLTWDGSYSSVSVQWDTSSGFITNDNSMNDLSITNAVITGLTANTNIILEYCRILQRASLAGTAIRIMRLLTEDFHVRRNIHEFGGGEPVLDGSLSTVDILRNTTGSFSPFTGVTTSDVQDCPRRFRG